MNKKRTQQLGNLLHCNGNNNWNNPTSTLKAKTLICQIMRNQGS